MFWYRYILPTITFIFYRSLVATWRIELHMPDSMKTALKERSPFIIAHWHGDELGLIHLAKKIHACAIISQSKDGTLMNQVIRWLGAETTRGSSSRGGIGALKGLLKLTRAGFNPAFAVDGPKGPIYKTKPGVFEVSKLCRVPIYPAGVAASSAWTFHKAWNKAFLPKPFARVVVYWQDCLPAVGEDEDPRDQKLALRLESSIHGAKDVALKYIAGHGA